MQKPPLSLPPVLARKLRQFDRARRRVLGLRALAEALSLLGMGILAVAAVEGCFHPGLFTRVVLSTTIQVLAGLWLIFRSSQALARRTQLRDIARDFESAAAPAGTETIWSAVQFAQAASPTRGLSQWMAGQTIERAAGQIETMDPPSLLGSPALVRRWQVVGVVSGLLLICLVVGMSGRIWLAINPFASTLVLSRVQFLVKPGNCAVVEGTNLIVTAAANRLPENPKLALTWADGVHERISLTQVGTNLFQCAIPAVSQSLSYQIVAEQAESPVFGIRLLSPPRLSRLLLRIQSPPYAHQTNKTVEGGSADFLQGSTVSVEVLGTREPIEHAEFCSPQWTTQQFRLADARLLFHLQPTNPISYGIKLMGANRLESETPIENLLNPIADLPPTVSLEAAGIGQGLVQRDELLPLAVRASDDVGLQRVDLVILSPDLRRQTRNLFDAATNSTGLASAGWRDYSASPVISLPDLKPGIGDGLQLIVVATDLKGQTNQSNPVAITIGSSEKTLEARLATRLKVLVADLRAAMENLAQTRFSWSALGRSYRDQDRGSDMAAIALVKGRVGEIEREVDRIGRSLVDESRTNDVSDARFIYRLGTSVSAWAREQDQVLQREVDRLGQASLDDVSEIFRQGRDLFNLASTDLVKFTHVTALLQGALEADVLATRTEAAQGRYKRGFPILRGSFEDGIEGLMTGSGLDVTFYEGTDLTGRVLEKKVDVPQFENYAPAKRHEQWSCRYEGEIDVWEAGMWTIACVADDGVRLTLDGASVLPPGAWSAHPATEYRADLDLHRGWHPITIEFFQGSSLSKLQLLIGKQSHPLHEVQAYRLRPVSAGATSSEPVTNSIVSPEVMAQVRSRVTASLLTASSVPMTLSGITNGVDIEVLTFLVANEAASGVGLSNSLEALATWSPRASSAAEAQADALTELSLDAQQMLRTELDKYRWRYEGAAVLKNLQTSIDELRAINDQLRKLPWNQNKEMDDKEQAQVNLGLAWQQELERTAADAAHSFFEQARQKDATLAERIWAIKASAKASHELVPTVAKLESALDQNRNKNEMADEIDRRLNEISDRYRELNDIQERMNREHTAALARAALPPVRAFARSQKQANDPSKDQKFEDAHGAVDGIAEAERVVGDYREAFRLEALSGDSPSAADGAALLREVQGIASQTDNAPPSLAQTIPPPMQRETDALAGRQEDGAVAASHLAVPRLAISLEAARLRRQGDRKAANAYELLGQDLGEAINASATLDREVLQPLTDRALALAGAKGNEVRQAEIRGAETRLARLPNKPASPNDLAAELDSLSALAMDATKDGSKDQPLMNRLDVLTKLGSAPQDWAESSDPAEVAAGAAHESKEGLETDPRSWEAHHDASEILADAAQQIRMDGAVRGLAHQDPFPSGKPNPPSDQPSTEPSEQSDPASRLNGRMGRSLTQKPPAGLDQAEWARLSERLGKGIRNTGVENFSEEQRAAIQAYFEKLGSTQ